MKIAFLHSSFPKLSATFIYREVEVLSELQFVVYNYSLRKPVLSTLSIESVKYYNETYYLLPISPLLLLKCHFKYIFYNFINYIRSFYVNVVSIKCSLKNRFRALMHFGEGIVLAHKMQKDKISHIHAHYASQPTSVARIISTLSGIPFSFSAHAHDIWHDKLAIPEKLNDCKFVTVCSEFGRKKLIDQANSSVSKKIYTVYHGLNVDKFPFQEFDFKRQKNYIISVGRLTEQKGFKDLIRSCQILLNRDFYFKCEIIGEGEQRSDLLKLIKKHKLNNKVHLIGAVTQENIKKYYQEAWIFVLPCVDTHDGNRDGIPNVLMEAMSSGCPVITTNNSAQSELITHYENGLIVPPNSPENLAAQIIELCNNDELRNSVKINARKTIESKFDNKYTNLSLIKIFEKYIYEEAGSFSPTPRL